MEFINVSIEKALQDKCSYVAIDMNQPRVVGVSLNVIESVNDKTNVLDSSRFKSEKLRYLFKIIESVHGDVDLFKIFNTNRLLHLLIVAIDEKYRGLKLTGPLFNVSLELAKTYGIKGAFCETTGLYSAKAILKMGFQVYNEIIYAKYDQKRLSNLGVHDRCLLIAKSL